MTSLVTANVIWRKPMTPGDFWKFEHKGGEKQIKSLYVWCQYFVMKINVSPKSNNAI